ncbi:hypothetical protein [Desulfonatronum lacustre]|uniref:hypothetical protein n=1 Tax=Desulfonatronum lacustre TaxID=66849 RepID=UPI00048DBF50|nr:hypothetical protein [Desulfonatronum lacustre]
MFGKKTVPLLILAMGMFLGSACGPDPEEYEIPARPGESPPGYELPPGQERPQERSLMQPEAPMGESEPGQGLQPNGQGREQGVPFDAQPKQ